MRFAWLIFVGIMGCAQTLYAGAWMRETGASFASGAVTLSWPQDVHKQAKPAPASQYQSLYFEHGLSRRLTLGIDVGRTQTELAKVIGFAQIPLRGQDDGPKAALALGIGQINTRPVVRPGIYVGKGRDTGWMSADAMAEIQTETGQTDYKLDLTYGINLKKGRKLILQMQTGVPAEYDPYARFAPSMVFPLTKHLKAEAGVSLDLTGSQMMGLKLGLWAEF